MIVFLERGAAAGGVGNDGVEVFEKKYREIFSREFACGVNDAVRIGEQVPENEVARDASEPGARIVALDARAGVLDEFSIFDPGGAGGFTGAAVETFVDVVDEGIRDGLLVQFDMNHLMDAAARRIGFEVPQAIGGAGIEAEAAMDTARD